MSKFNKLKYGDMRQVVRNTGKGATEQRLPGRSAVNTLTKGDPFQRTINNYAKQTPGLGDQSPSILDYGASSSDDY